eukprot:5391482-Amphidinium_carterae.1
MANVEQFVLQRNQLQQKLQQQHPRMQQVLQSQASDRLPSLVGSKGIGEPATFWREWLVKFESFVVGVYGEDMRVALAWASAREVDI